MTKDEIDKKDNAELMTLVKEARALLRGATKDGTNTPSYWNLFHLLRYAEEAMKFRNLPLDHEKLGPVFSVTDFRSNTLLVTEN